MNIAFWKISAHLASRFSRVVMPPSSFLPMAGTSQMPTIMDKVMTREMFTNCWAVRLSIFPSVKPMALTAFPAAMAS